MSIKFGVVTDFLLLPSRGAVELQEWIDTINIIAASLSAPPLPSAVGSQAKFQRPLMPSSHTSLSIVCVLFGLLTFPVVR